MTVKAASLAALALLVAGGCRRDEVTHYRVPKELAASPGLTPASAAAAPPGMAGDVAPPPPPSSEGRLTWTLPSGWTQSLTGGMRYATLKTPVAGKLDVSV